MARSVYVVRLEDRVWEESRQFREAKPHYPGRGGKGCCYVGQTGVEIDERFRQHKSGHRSSRLVKKYGRYLMRQKCLLDVTNSSAEACVLEAEVAQRLRRQGWAVWFN